MLRRVLLTAALIIGIAAAPAAAQYGPPGLVISPGTVRPGDSVSFTGTGCLPNQEVVISIQHRSGSAPVEVTRVMADGEGRFEGSFEVPDVPYGAYDVISSCGEVLSSAALQILAPDQTTPTTPPGGGSTTPPGAGGTGASQGGGRSGPLPATGSDFNVLGLVGLGLLAAGGLVLLTTRTRSSRTA